VVACKPLLVSPLVAAAWAAVLWAGEPVVLRSSQGYFLRVDRSGRLVPGGLCPGPEETFQLLQQRRDQLILESSHGHRLTVVDGRLVHTIREAKGDPPVVEIYRYDELPAPLRSALSISLTALTANKLKGQVYDEERSELKVERIRLPAPTLRDWNRTKDHRLFAVRQQYWLRAELDGPPAVMITQVPCLRSLDGEGQTVILFAAQAVLPVRGRVRYRVPHRLSVSTAYRATITLAVVGQLIPADDPDQPDSGLPELVELRAEISDLDIANDLLNVARAPIEDLINRQLRRKSKRIRREANEVIAEALKKPELRAPLARYIEIQ